MPLKYLFIDFNSYFASIEQQEKPKLRCKPVIVVPVDTDTTCAIAASYEAKKFGVKTGTLVSEAKKMCPGLKTVVANHRLYIDYHHRLIEAVHSCIPVEDVHSIDEMSCVLMGKQCRRENAIELARQIKKTIRENVGGVICCSIGIAPNLFLAKTGTDMQKPDGLVVIEEKDLPGILFTLKLNEIVGIGRKMEPRLRTFGIYTVEQLCMASKKLLRDVWGGIEGERMYAQLRGEIVNRPPTHRSTIGHSHVLEPDLRTQEGAYGVLNRLTQKAATRLRYLGYVAGEMSIGVKYAGQKRWHDNISFARTENTTELIHAFDTLWENRPLKDTKPLAVSVALFKLMNADQNTPSLFENYDKMHSLNKAVDKLNKMYGYSSAYYAGSHVALNSAPMRIAFTQIPNPEIEDGENKIKLKKTKEKKPFSKYGLLSLVSLLFCFR